MFIPWAPLLEAGLRSPAGPGWERLFPDHAVLFTKGRFALQAGLRRLAAVRGLRRVWLPAFLCRGVVDVVLACGLEPAFYDVGETLAPRLDAVDLTPADGVLVVHFFGLALPMGPLRALAEEHGAALIEDCAHTLPEPGAVSGPGAWGDVAVFSVRKLAPVPDGAVLLVRPSLGPAADLAPTGPRGPVRRKLALMVIERLAFNLGWNLLPVKEPLLAAERARSVARPSALGGAAPRPARLLPALLRRVDWASLISRRQHAYRHLAARLADVPGVHLPVPALPPGSVPQTLPICLPDASAAYRGLRRAGIEAMRWPGIEQVQVDAARYPGAAAWLAHSLCLPLGAPLTVRHLDAVADGVAREAWSQLPRARALRFRAG